MAENIDYNGPKVEPPLEHLRRVIENISNRGHDDIQLKKEYRSIIISGMGGSGIAGSIVADLCNKESSKPVHVLRTNTLPKWVNDNTLLIVVSYSGNTQETIDVYNEAKTIGCGIVVITTGGNLSKIANEDNTPIIKIEGGYMPRSDIGFVILGIINVLKSNDSSLFLDTKMASILSSVKDYAELLSNKDNQNNCAVKIAKRLKGKLPFIYASETIQSVASRWKAQLNENAKVVSAACLFPEFCHNSLEGWGNNSCPIAIPVLLRIEEEGTISKYMDVVSQLMNECGNPFIEVKIDGSSMLEKILRGIILGDYVSLYLAEMNGVDPSAVPTITEFKQRL